MKNKNEKPSTIIDAAVAVLMAWGPRKTPDIMHYMAVGGMEVKGKRPIQTLYGVLRRNALSAHPRVKRNNKGLWILVY